MRATRSSPPRRHVPERTCISCRSVSTKRQLIRIVRTPDGSVEVDPSGKRPGRGAYLCSAGACWQQALKKGALSRALKVQLAEADRASLAQFAATLAPVAPA